jgi:hypothetical protein
MMPKKGDISFQKGGMGKMILSKHQMIILPTQAMFTLLSPLSLYACFW